MRMTAARSPWSFFAWLLALGGLLTGALPAQQVTLPLDRYDALRKRAEAAPPPEPEPPAPLAFEEAVLTVEVGEHSARVIHDLTLVLFADGWLSVPLPELGTFIEADFGEIEGRLESGAGWTLTVRGSGRRQVSLTTVVPVTFDDGTRRPTRRMWLSAPPAALVRGVLDPGDGVEKVESDGLLLLAASGDGRRAFSLSAGSRAEIVLLGPSTAPAREALPLRFEADSAIVLEVSRHRRRAHAWLDVRVLQGELDELAMPLPDGFEVLAVDGEITGWDAVAGRLTVTPRMAVSDRLRLELELAAGAVEEFESPVLVLEGAAGGSVVAKVAMDGDGLLELLAAGSSRRLAAPAADLPPGFHDASGIAFESTPGDPPPRWRVRWAEATEVLAAQVDRLLVDCLVGESGRAYYQLWAEVRARGAPQLELTLPAGGELVAVRRDDRLMGAGFRPPAAAGVRPSAATDTWVVPLRAADAPQVVYLAAVLPLVVPEDGDFELPLPWFSAPVGRVEVRAQLPGERRYDLAESARAGSAGRPAAPAAEREPSNLARQLGVAAAAGSGSDAPALYPTAAGSTVVEAAWGALTSSPSPLRLEIDRHAARPEWF